MKTRLKGRKKEELLRLCGVCHGSSSFICFPFCFFSAQLPSVLFEKCLCCVFRRRLSVGLLAFVLFVKKAPRLCFGKKKTPPYCPSVRGAAKSFSFFTAPQRCRIFRRGKILRGGHGQFLCFKTWLFIASKDSSLIICSILQASSAAVSALTPSSC